MIYFAQAESGGPVKIGFSVRPRLRLKQLSPALRLIGLRHGTKTDERNLHQRLAADRLDGEWFAPTESVLAEAQAECQTAITQTEREQRSIQEIWPILIRVGLHGKTTAEIAKIANVTPRTVGHWKAGSASPQAPAALAMGAASPIIGTWWLMMLDAADLTATNEAFRRWLEDNEKDPAKVLDEIRKLMERA